MPDTYAAEPRSELGKAAARLRRQGILPANVFGRGVESTAVQLPTRDAVLLLKEHGINTLVNLQVAGEPAPRSVVVRSIKRHPVNHQLQHVDFYQVDLKRAITASIPVTIVGEAPAVHTYRGVLLHGADHVTVEALPAEVPTHLEVSIDGITELDQSVTVADLTVPSGVTILTSPDTMLARVAAPRVMEEGEAVPEGEQPEAAAAGEAADTTEAGEGAEESAEQPAE
jgi:large subunit ribosomal protein L25